MAPEGQADTEPLHLKQPTSRQRPAHPRHPEHQIQPCNFNFISNTFHSMDHAKTYCRFQVCMQPFQMVVLHMMITLLLARLLRLRHLRQVLCHRRSSIRHLLPLPRGLRFRGTSRKQCKS